MMSGDLVGKKTVINQCFVLFFSFFIQKSGGGCYHLSWAFRRIQKTILLELFSIEESPLLIEKYLAKLILAKIRVFSIIPQVSPDNCSFCSHRTECDSAWDDGYKARVITSCPELQVNLFLDAIGNVFKQPLKLSKKNRTEALFEIYERFYPSLHFKKYQQYLD